MTIALRRRPLIDDVAAVQLRNKVYEARDAHKEYDKVREELNGYSTWSFIQQHKSLANRAPDDAIADVKRTIADLEQKRNQYENAERIAYLELGDKILKLVPSVAFEDDDPNEVPDIRLDNGDCYMLLNFVEFLCGRGLMKEPTFSDAKKLILDFDKFGADDDEIEEAP